jgi:hypothetical protein
MGSGQNRKGIAVSLFKKDKKKKKKERKKKNEEKVLLSDNRCSLWMGR